MLTSALGTACVIKLSSVHLFSTSQTVLFLDFGPILVLSPSLTLLASVHLFGAAIGKGRLQKKDGCSWAMLQNEDWMIYQLSVVAILCFMGNQAIALEWSIFKHSMYRIPKELLDSH